MQGLEERLKSYEPLWENWYIDSYVGKGSSSVVYKIKQDRFGEIGYGALKIISISIDDEVGASYEQRLRSLNEKKQRAKNEINNMYKLKNCAAVVHCLNHVIKDIKDDNGQNIGFDILIRMEYYTCLSKYMMEKGGSLTQKEVENLALQIGSGIKAVHALNIIHRDIKPENFFIDEKGNYLLGDFGVSKQLSNETSCSTVAGTQPYIAPEIYKVGANRHYTQTADIYSFGIVLYTLLNNNCLPLTNEQSSANEIQSAIDCRLAGDRFPEPINGSRALKSIVMKACQYNSEDRYQSMDELLEDLEMLKQGKSLPIVERKSKNGGVYETKYADDEKGNTRKSRKKKSVENETSIIIEPPKINNGGDKEDRSGTNVILVLCLCFAFVIVMILVMIIMWLFVMTSRNDSSTAENVVEVATNTTTTTTSPPAETQAKTTAEQVVTERTAVDPKECKNNFKLEGSTMGYCNVEQTILLYSDDLYDQQDIDIYMHNKVIVYGSSSNDEFDYIGFEVNGEIIKGYVNGHHITEGDPSEAQQTRFYSATRGVAANYDVVAVNSKPEIGTKKDELKKGESFEVLSYNGYMFYIRYDGGKTGYVSFKACEVE